jgi:hypothetical protein
MIRAPHEVRPPESICTGVSPGAIRRLLRGTDQPPRVPRPADVQGAPPQRHVGTDRPLGHHRAAAHDIFTPRRRP